MFGYYVDKGYISIQGFFVRGGKLLERELSIQPLYEQPQDAFISFILQYYAKNPLPQEILLPKEYEIEHLQEILSEAKILQPLRGDKLKLVENRLLHSEMRISEIVAELGFTDESHLNKLFKKYRGCSPTNFRKNNAV